MASRHPAPGDEMANAKFYTPSNLQIVLHAQECARGAQVNGLSNTGLWIIQIIQHPVCRDFHERDSR